MRLIYSSSCRKILNSARTAVVFSLWVALECRTKANGTTMGFHGLRLNTALFVLLITHINTHIHTNTHDGRTHVKLQTRCLQLRESSVVYCLRYRGFLFFIVSAI